ncbi:MAG TPA: single-stranded DNA-binding protein [Edaphobacter sp.]|nr:single-stranded DNA-binding protein [Edaphobacter sp.]
MALYKNTHSIKGFVGKDAESFATKQQRTFVVFSVATKSGYKDKQTGQWVNHTEWHRIVAFGTPSDYAKDLKKGDYVEVEGEVRSTDFDKEVGDGKKKVKVTSHDKEVRATKIKKLVKPESSNGDNHDTEPITEDDAA